MTATIIEATVSEMEARLADAEEAWADAINTIAGMGVELRGQSQVIEQQRQRIAAVRDDRDQAIWDYYDAIQAIEYALSSLVKAVAVIDVRPGMAEDALQDAIQALSKAADASR